MNYKYSVSLQKSSLLILPFSVVFLFFTCTTQAQDLVWAKQAGGASLDLGSNITVDASGNSYAIGVFEGLATFGGGDNETTLTSVGSFDIFITKYGNNGGLLWAKQITNTQFEAWADIAVDASGAIYLTSPFHDTTTLGIGETNETTLTSVGSEDIFIAKYNTEGMFLWVKQAGGDGRDRGTEIAVDDSGNSYVSGFFGESATFGLDETNEITLTSVGAWDAYLAKYDIAGMLLWVKGIGGVGFDSGEGIAVDASGNIYVMGWFGDNITFGMGEANETTLSADSVDTFLAKYNAEGSLLWVAQSNGNLIETGAQVACDASGNSYITGIFEGSATFGQGENNQTTLNSLRNDIFVAKYDVNGLLLWAKRAGGSGFDFGHSVAIDASGNSYVTGSFEGLATFGIGETNQTILRSTGGSDIFVAAYNNDGLLLRAVHAGGSRFDMGSGIAVGPSDDIYVTGRFHESAILGEGEPNETTLNSAGITDIFVARFSPGAPTSADGVTAGDDDFHLIQNYPNPFNPTTTISYSLHKSGHVKVSIYNVLGQKIKMLLDENQKSGNHRLQWDGTNNSGLKVTSGVYYYRIDAGDKRVVKSMLLVK